MSRDAHGAHLAPGRSNASDLLVPDVHALAALSVNLPPWSPLARVQRPNHRGDAGKLKLSPAIGFNKFSDKPPAITLLGSPCTCQWCLARRDAIVLRAVQCARRPDGADASPRRLLMALRKVNEHPVLALLMAAHGHALFRDLSRSVFKILAQAKFTRSRSIVSNNLPRMKSSRSVRSTQPLEIPCLSRIAKSFFDARNWVST